MNSTVHTKLSSTTIFDFFFFQAEDGIRDDLVTGVQTCALPIWSCVANLRDGDHVYAVIRGCALNNDGSSKVGYTAPSVEGQSRVIAMAQEAAGVSPESIGYIEAHGKIGRASCRERV